MNIKSIYHILNKCYQKTILTNKDRAKRTNFLRNLQSFPADRVTESLAGKKNNFGKIGAQLKSRMFSYLYNP